MVSTTNKAIRIFIDQLVLKTIHHHRDHDHHHHNQQQQHYFNI